jgi:hypothetical protein
MKDPRVVVTVEFSHHTYVHWPLPRSDKKKKKSVTMTSLGLGLQATAGGNNQKIRLRCTILRAYEYHEEVSCIARNKRNNNILKGG